MMERKVKLGFELDFGSGRARIEGEVKRLAEIRDRATPPAAMFAAPVAPARGPQQLVPSVTVVGGGMRRIDGAHWRAVSPLSAACAHALARHQARNPDAPFVAPYSPGQIAMAEDYAALVEWREAGGIRCASLEAGRGGSGGGSGLFIDSYVDKGAWLAELQRRIGPDVALSVRRHMDRGNHRRSITVRAAVDMLVLGAVPVKTILVRFGWSYDMRVQKTLRQAICGALDRMQGYRGPDPQHGA